MPSTPPWSPTLLPASVPRPPALALHPSRFLEATPTWLVFKAASTPAPQQPLLPPLPRVSPPPSAGPQHIPVAHQTRARLAALAVLNRDTGKLLEHRQLCKDPRYKTVWDCSYANKLGHLCQGLGTGDKAGGKRVAGTNTFHLVAYANIPHRKQKQIIYTKVV